LFGIAKSAVRRYWLVEEHRTDAPQLNSFPAPQVGHGGTSQTPLITIAASPDEEQRSRDSPVVTVCRFTLHHADGWRAVGVIARDLATVIAAALLADSE
jgi:hypothetical protein